MKKLNLLVLLCLLFVLPSCKIETVKQHNENIGSYMISSDVSISSVAELQSETEASSLNNDTVASDTLFPSATTVKKTEKAEKTEKTTVPTTVATTTTQKKSLSVSVSIDCTNALSANEKGISLPSNGYFLKDKNIEIAEGDTAFTVVSKACSQSGIHLDYTGKPKLKTVYINGIGGLYEKDCGSESGWKYKVDGVVPGVGCSNYTLHGGETIIFYYTLKVNE